MTSESGSANDRERQVQQILELFDRLYQETRRTSRGARGEWLNIDLTMPQVKSLLTLFTDGTLRTSDLASVLGVSLPSVTGIVDRLEEKGLVTRESDPQDRRVVLCKLSEVGRHLMGSIWQTGLERVKELLEAMTLEELQLVEGGVRAFLHSITTIHPELVVESPNEEES